MKNPRALAVGGCTLLLLGLALATPRLAAAGEVSFIAPTLHVQESASTQTYTADVLISDTSTSDIIAEFQLDLFLQPTTVFNSASPGSTETNVAYGLSTGFDFSTNTVSTGGLVISNTAAEPYLYNNQVSNGGGNQPDSSDLTDIAFPPGFYLSSYTSSLQGGGSINEVYPADTFSSADDAQMTQTWALARIYITVAANYQGTEYLVWNNNGIANDDFAPYYSLSTNVIQPLDPTLVMGEVIVGGPEPSSIVLMTLGALAACAVGYRRRRALRA